MKKLVYFLFILGFIGCNNPEARRPVKVNTGSYIKQSIERNKELLAQEEKFIAAIIEKDTLNHYTHSPNGAWYYYHVKNEQDTYTAKPDDLVTMTYNLVDFNNDTIYSNEEIGTFTYKVDKQELFLGLRNSVKLLKENETATFLYPSSLGYGYHGDNKKIGTNIPLKATVSIIKIEKQKDSIQN